ncbi:hypothetical protein LHK_02737 [Laribacter hongkongensis HLHK9]|uniref:Uncharacterized protein n=1 Tax=Laribacter hongkongensis (strain HLHK9) TaxID=557598 RepID=C1DD86_LARHH|nr:hypothetical protein LHK_02737 [Laribacter hongkongensis HLHK9]
MQTLVISQKRHKKTCPASRGACKNPE